MITKTKASILLGTVLSAGMVFAQTPSLTPTPDANATQSAPAQQGNFQHNFDPGKRAVRMGKQLGLSNDQVAQLKPILADQFQQMQTLRGDNSLSQQDRHAKMRTLMQDSNTKIEALLNDTQKQQYEQMLANRRNHERNRQGQAQPQA
jgi:hypothetical protein